MTGTDAGQDYRHTVASTYNAPTLLSIEYGGAAEDGRYSTEQDGIL